MAKITNFELYLNFCESGDDPSTVMFGNFSKHMDLNEVVEGEIYSGRKNRNLIEKFCIEARIKLNKDPKKNNKPIVDVNLVIGGKFQEGRNELLDSEQGIGFFKLQKQQMNCILKYLDYSANYTKFTLGVEEEFLSKKLSKDDEAEYMDLYEDFKNQEGFLEFRPNKEEAKVLK